MKLLLSFLLLGIFAISFISALPLPNMNPGKTSSSITNTNNTFNNITIVNGTSYNATYDETSADVLANRSAWFSTFNSTYATFAYNQTTPAINYCIANFYSITNPLNFLNETTISNSTIARIGNCSAGYVVQNTTSEGVQCVPMTLSGVNPFNQSLNTTDNVRFKSIIVNPSNVTQIGLLVDNSASPYSNNTGTAQDLFAQQSNIYIASGASPTSNLRARGYAIKVDNNNTFTGSGNVGESTTGLINEVIIRGQHNGTGVDDFSEDNYGIQNVIQNPARNLKMTQFASTRQVSYYGMDNQVASSDKWVNSEGDPLTVQSIGVNTNIVTTPTYGGTSNLSVNNYGNKISITGTRVGISTNYGEYIGTITGALNNYGLYFANIFGGVNNYAIYVASTSATSNFLGGNNLKTYFGNAQRSSIYYNASDFIINPKDVGTGKVIVLGDLNAQHLEGDGSRITNLSKWNRTGNFLYTNNPTLDQVCIGQTSCSQKLGVLGGFNYTGMGYLSNISVFDSVNNLANFTSDMDIQGNLIGKNNITGTIFANAKTNIPPITLSDGLVNNARVTSGANAGALEYANNSLYFTNWKVRRTVVQGQNVILQNQTVTNTLTETQIYSQPHGADYLKVGKMEDIELYGLVNSASGVSDTAIVRVKYAGTTIGTFNIPKSLTNADTLIQITTTVRAIGAGTTEIQLRAIANINGISNDPVVNTLVTGLDSTSQQNTTVTIQWANAVTGNRYDLLQGRSLSIDNNLQ